MRTKKVVVVLISGKAGVGKSTLSEFLRNRLEEIEGITTAPYGFANPIKYISKAYFGWDGEKDDRGRKLLQDIGKVGREYNDNLWVTHLLTQMDRANKERGGLFPTYFWIVDDWRFENEAETLRKNPMIDVVTIRVFGRETTLNGERANDVSEVSLPEAEFEDLGSGVLQQYYDISVENSGDFGELGFKADLILAEIRKNYIVE